jgi:DNA topoisomerase-3
MRLVIAEKASVARAIAAVVPQDVQVTHCVGHLLELADPATYDVKWKNWSVDVLPIRVTDWKLVPKDKTRQQLSTVGALLKRATEVIHAGDPDREGQLLVDEVLQYFGWRGPTKRMLVTDVHPDGLLKAWRNLKENADYQPLRQAAECRQRADWLVGMNLTRATTRLLSDGALVSIGRVQTPTLALVVRRHKAIAGFKEQIFYTLRAELSLSGNRTLELKCEPDPRITDERQAAALAKAVTGQSTTLQVRTEDKARRSPLPYKLGDFQKAAEHHFGWSLDKALKSLQSAYVAGWVSYPRSDCRYLPSDHKAGAVAIANTVASALGVPGTLLANLTPRDRVYDSSKVKVHYGIVPTGAVPPANADADGLRAWKLVSLHYLRTLMPDECFRETVVTTQYATAAAAPYHQLLFKAKGETPDGGTHWGQLDLDAILPPPRKRKAAVLPPLKLPRLSDGETAACVACTRSQGKTTPPKSYTEATLRDDMENVAKYATDPKMQAILKETLGIGTAATQAAIVQTLLARGFIATAKNGTIDATPFGISVIDAIPPQLADPVLTAAWEKALGMIAEGDYSPAQFEQRVVALVDKHLAELRNARAGGTRIRTPEKRKPAAPRVAKVHQAAGKTARGHAFDNVFL